MFRLNWKRLWFNGDRVKSISNRIKVHGCFIIVLIVVSFRNNSRELAADFIIFHTYCNFWSLFNRRKIIFKCQLMNFQNKLQLIAHINSIDLLNADEKIFFSADKMKIQLKWNSIEMVSVIPSHLHLQEKKNKWITKAFQIRNLTKNVTTSFKPLLLRPMKSSTRTCHCVQIDWLDE